MQPLDQEIIANAKTFYQMRVHAHLRRETESGVELQQMLDEMSGDEDEDDELPNLPVPTPDNQSGHDSPDDLPPANTPQTPQEGQAIDFEIALNPQAITVTQFWRNFTIKNAVDALVEAWGDVNEATLRRAWEKLTPHLVTRVEGAQRLTDTVEQAATEARRVPGFNNVTVEEIRDVNEGGNEQTAEGIVQEIAVEDNLVREPAVLQEEDMAEKPLTMQQLSAILASAEILKHTVLEVEQSKLKRDEFCFDLEKLIRSYREAHVVKINERKQTLIDRYIRQPQQDQPEVVEVDEPPPNLEPNPEPVAGPSGVRPMSLPSNEEFEGFMRDVKNDSTNPLQCLCSLGVTNPSSSEDSE